MILLDELKSWLNSLGDWVCNSTMEQLSKLLASICEAIGYSGELIGALCIVVGLFMIRFRNTSVLRWGFIIYGISFLVEMIGLTLK